MAGRQRSLSYDEKTQLILIGQRMSNALFNWSQWSTIPEATRQTMRELQREWDSVRHNGAIESHQE